jgi:hypothetical protein
MMFGPCRPCGMWHVVTGSLHDSSIKSVINLLNFWSCYKNMFLRNTCSHMSIIIIKLQSCSIASGICFHILFCSVSWVAVSWWSVVLLWPCAERYYLTNYFILLTFFGLFIIKLCKYFLGIDHEHWHKHAHQDARKQEVFPSTQVICTRLLSYAYIHEFYFGIWELLSRTKQFIKRSPQNITLESCDKNIIIERIYICCPK